MVKNFEQYESESTLDVWKKLMDKNDLKYYSEFQNKSESDLEQIRGDFKVMRTNALKKLNNELNKSGKSGSIMNIDVSDEELYPYVDDKYKKEFFRYSRILDFKDGYKPKDIIIIKKGIVKESVENEEEYETRVTEFDYVPSDEKITPLYGSSFNYVDVYWSCDINKESHGVDLVPVINKVVMNLVVQEIDSVGDIKEEYEKFLEFDKNITIEFVHEKSFNNMISIQPIEVMINEKKDYIKIYF